MLYIVYQHPASRIDEQIENSVILHVSNKAVCTQIPWIQKRQYLFKLKNTQLNSVQTVQCIHCKLYICWVRLMNSQSFLVVFLILSFPHFDSFFPFLLFTWSFHSLVYRLSIVNGLVMALLDFFKKCSIKSLIQLVGFSNSLLN